MSTTLTPDANAPLAEIAAALELALDKKGMAAVWIEDEQDPIDYEQHYEWLKSQSTEILQEMMYKQPLPPALDHPIEARVQALRHAADWIDEGAPLGHRSALFTPVFDADERDTLGGDAIPLYYERCAVGEAMLFLDGDPKHWLAVTPHRALLRWEEPAATTRLLTDAIEAFDSSEDRKAECSSKLRQIAELLTNEMLTRQPA